MTRTVSWLGIFICLPAFAGARLPAVNVSAAAVSARAEFGMPVTTTVVKKSGTNEQSFVTSADTNKKDKILKDITYHTTKKMKLQEFFILFFTFVQLLFSSALALNFKIKKELFRKKLLLFQSCKNDTSTLPMPPLMRSVFSPLPITSPSETDSPSTEKCPMPRFA